MKQKKFITLLDLLKEEQDSFAQKPFDKMDAFVLSVASYLQWENSLVFKNDSSFDPDTSLFPDQAHSRGVYLGQALNGIPKGQEADIFWFNEVANEFMEALGSCPRYETVRVSDAAWEVDPSQFNQFAAVTFHIPDGSLFVSFRGTDSTVTGWEEDFLLAIMSPIPSQIMATNYLNTVVACAQNGSCEQEVPSACEFVSLQGASSAQKQASTQGMPVEQNAAYAKENSLSQNGKPFVVRVGGHSKGGNLAFYAAKHCSAKAQEVLLDVYSFDGPGFAFSEVEAHKQEQKEKAFVAKEKNADGFAQAATQTALPPSGSSPATVQNTQLQFVKPLHGPYFHKYVPSESVFGKLFYDLVPPQVVQSSVLGLMQHQPFTWKISQRDFVFDEDTTVLSRFSEQVFDGWIDSLSLEEKTQFLGICFGTVDYLAELAQSDHIEDLPAALPKALPVLASSLKTMDDESRQCVTDVLSCLAGEFFLQVTSSMHPLWSKSSSC